MRVCVTLVVRKLSPRGGVTASIPQRGDGEHRHFPARSGPPIINSKSFMDVILYMCQNQSYARSYAHLWCWSSSSCSDMKASPWVIWCKSMPFAFPFRNKSLSPACHPRALLGWRPDTWKTWGPNAWRSRNAFLYRATPEILRSVCGATTICVRFVLFYFRWR